MSKVGRFINEEREYLIENIYPKRPLKNYLFNEGFIMDVDQFGFGLSKACINKVFRPLIYDHRIAYVKDNDSGEYYDINRNFSKKPFAYHRTRVGMGYHVVESEYNAIQASFALLIPKENFVEMHQIKLKNVGKGKRSLSLVTYINPNVNISEHQAYTKARYDENLGGLYFAHRPHKRTHEYVDIFYTADEKAVAWALSRDAFCGTYGSVNDPEALKQRYLPCDKPIFEPYYAGVMQFDIELNEGEEKVIHFAVGVERNYEECVNLAKKYSNSESFESEIAWQKQLAEGHISTAVIDTEDEYLNTMANIWLKRQMSLGKTWGRVYGKGFRDVLQDITGFVSLDKPLARERLLYTLKHQFINGNAIRMFDPILDHPYQDMGSWIASTILAYLKESGDFSVLDEPVGYYDDSAIEPVFMHLKRSIDFLFDNQGAHGLSLWGGGDWNDSIDSAGLQMIGESVWLSIATVNASRDYLEILEQIEVENKEQIIADVIQKRELLKQNLIKHGLKDGRFIYGINDWGEYVGAEECKEGKVFLNPQTWAAMSDILPLKERRKLMDVVEERLKCPYGYTLQDTPFVTPNDHLGRLTYFEKGVYENGSVYNHGVMFKVVADCVVGRGDNAWNTLKMNRYDNPLNADSGVEPYAVSNMYFGPCAESKVGYAPLSWITGSAGWMYRAIIEFLLGVKPEFYGLKLQPCLPTSWNGAKIKRNFRGVKYDIEFIPGNEFGVFVDGNKIEGNVIPLFEEGSRHTVICNYVKGEMVL